MLIALSSSNTAIKAAATSYTQLLAFQSDNNIKLIVLERLQDLKKQHPKVRATNTAKHGCFSIIFCNLSPSNSA